MGLYRNFIDILRRNTNQDPFTTAEVVAALEAAETIDTKVNELKSADADLLSKIKTESQSLSNHKNAKILDHPNRSVTTDKIADKAITADKLGDNSVTNAKIKNEAITTDSIAQHAVTTEKIHNGAVNSNCIADNAVITRVITAHAITSDKIANSAVELEHLSGELATLLNPTLSVEDLEKNVFDMQCTVEFVTNDVIPPPYYDNDQEISEEGKEATITPARPTLKLNGESITPIYQIEDIIFSIKSGVCILYKYDIATNIITAYAASPDDSGITVKNNVISAVLYTYSGIHTEFKVGDDNDYWVIDSYTAERINNGVFNITIIGSAEDLQDKDAVSVLEAVNHNTNLIETLSSVCNLPSEYNGEVIPINMTRYIRKDDTETTTIEMTIVCNNTINEDSSVFYQLSDNCGVITELNQTGGATYSSCLIGNVIELCQNGESIGSSLEETLIKLTSTHVLHWNGTEWEAIDKSLVNIQSIDKRVDALENAVYDANSILETMILKGV